MKCPWSSLPDDNEEICSDDAGLVCLFKIMKDQQIPSKYCWASSLYLPSKVSVRCIFPITVSHAPEHGKS